MRILLFIVMGLQAWGEEFFAKRDWKAYKSDAGCISETQVDNKSRAKRYTGALRVLARPNKTADGYVEPTMVIEITPKRGQKLPKALALKAHGWGGQTGSSEKFDMLLAMNEGESTDEVLRFIVPIERRDDLYTILLRKSVLVATLYDNQKKRSSFHFSLRGSTDTVRQQFEECGLRIRRFD